MFNVHKRKFFEIHNNPPISAIPTTIAITPIEISINLDITIM